MEALQLTWNVIFYLFTRENPLLGLRLTKGRFSEINYLLEKVGSELEKMVNLVDYKLLISSLWNDGALPWLRDGDPAVRFLYVYNRANLAPLNTETIVKYFEYFTDYSYRKTLCDKGNIVLALISLFNKYIEEGDYNRRIFSPLLYETVKYDRLEVERFVSILRPLVKGNAVLLRSLDELQKKLEGSGS